MDDVSTNRYAFIQLFLTRLVCIGRIENTLAATCGSNYDSLAPTLQEISFISTSVETHNRLRKDNDLLAKCWTFRARFWYVAIRWAEYLSMIAHRVPSLAAHVLFSLDLNTSTVMFFGLCAPWNCDATLVEADVLPRFLSSSVFKTELVALPPPQLGQATISEMFPAVIPPAERDAGERIDAHVCLREYAASFHILSEVSGSAAVAISEPRVGLDANSWSIAEQQLALCWKASGRYWAVTVLLWEWWAELDPTIADVLDGDGVPREVFLGLCVPVSCTRDHIEGFIAIRFIIARMYYMEPEQITVRARQGLVKARELTHWSMLSLDFAIAGVNSCGTRSLYTGLTQHSDIAFTKSGEDDMFFQDNSVLPSNSMVEMFNKLWKSVSQRPSMLGLRHPGLFRSARMRQALSRIPNFRLIIIVCDPLGYLDKNFFLYHQTIESPKGHCSKPKDDSRCWPNLSVAIDDPQLHSIFSNAEHLRELLRLFGRRLFLVHQEQMRIAPRRTFNALAAFLGLAPFPPEVRFGRHGSLQGHRTQVCRDSSLYFAVKRRLANEYSSLEEVLKAAGATVPLVLRRRITRCERRAEFDKQENVRSNSTWFRFTRLQQMF